MIHQRERSAGQAMKRGLRRQQAVALGECAGKLDRRLHPFAARTAEISLVQAASGFAAQYLGKLTCRLRYMALQHRRATPVQLTVQRLDYRGMVVTNVV